MYNITLETESVSRPGWPFECWNVWSFKLLFFFMWGFEVCVSMHVGVGRRLSGVVCCGSGCWVLGVALGISLVQAALPLSHLNGSGMDIYLKLV